MTLLFQNNKNELRITTTDLQDRYIIEFKPTDGLPKETLAVKLDEDETVVLKKIRTSPRPKGCGHAAVYEFSKEAQRLSRKVTNWQDLLKATNPDIRYIYQDHIGAQHAAMPTFEAEMNYNNETWKQWYLPHDAFTSQTNKDIGSFPKIAIFDSGIEVDNQGDIVHPNLLMRKDTIHLRAVDFDGKDVPASREEIIDYNGHGTHIAGLIGAAHEHNEGMRGLNSQAPLYIYKCTQGATAYVYLSNMLDAIYSFIINLSEDDLAILNVSMGFAIAYESLPLPCIELLSYLERMPNILMVCSAGNEFKAKIDFPASGSKNTPIMNTSKNNNILAIGAFDCNNNIAPFSNGGLQLSFLAPGVSIYSLYPSLYTVKDGDPLNYSGGYAYLEGTSMAAAITSGIISRFWSNDQTAQEVAKDVCDKVAMHSEKIQTSSNFAGYGLLKCKTLLNEISTPKERIHAKRRETLQFPEAELQNKLREVFLELFDENDPRLCVELMTFIRCKGDQPFDQKSSTIFEILSRFGYSFDSFADKKDAIAWGFLSLFDAKYTSVWNLKNILKRFIIDLDQREIIKSALGEKKGDKKMASEPVASMSDLSRFQVFLHQCWTTDPNVLKEFLLIFYPTEIELFDTTFTQEMVTAFVRMSADDNLIPIIPYTPDLTSRNLKCW